MKQLPKIRILLVLSVCCLFTVFAGAQQVNLNGRIYTKQNQPIPGAKVSFFNTAGALLDDCFTNSRGEFNVQNNRAFRRGLVVRVDVHAEGYDVFTREYTLSRGRFGTIQLDPLLKIKGVVKSDQGAYLDGVTVSFFDQSGNQRGVAVSSINGKYESEPLFRSNETITVTAKRPDYSEESKTVQVRSAVVVADFVLETRTVISGFVLDEVTLDPVPDAEVSFFDRDSRLITTRTTNQSGYYDFDNPFTLGEIVRVRMEKKDYRPGEETIIIAKGINRLDFKLLKKIDEGIKVIVRVYDRKGDKALEGVSISYQNRGARETQTAPNGETQFRINQRGGFDLPMRINKPGFREMQVTHRLREDEDNYVNINLLKAKTICPCFLYGAIGLAAVSGGSYWLSRKPYNDYKDFKNLDRQADYDTANRYVRIGTVTAGAAGAALAGWLICRGVEKKRIREMSKGRRRIGLSPFVPADGAGYQFGLAYRF